MKASKSFQSFVCKGNSALVALFPTLLMRGKKAFSETQKAQLRSQ
jgi:hypothetical protein